MRHATRDDLPAVKAMVREFLDYLDAIEGPDDGPVGSEALDRLEVLAFGDRPVCTVLIAERDGRAAGYMVYALGVDMDRVAPSLHIADLFVRAPDRRTGVGRALMKAAAAIARVQDIPTMFWTVWRKNPPAIAFYERIGAIAVDEEIPMALRVGPGQRGD